LHLHSLNIDKPSSRKFRRQYVNLLNIRRRRKKLRGVRHQRRRHSSGKMRLPSRLIRKSVEDAEGRRTHANGEPGSRGRFILDQRKRSAKKLRDLLLFSALRFQPDKQSYFRHFYFPSDVTNSEFIVYVLSGLKLGSRMMRLPISTALSTQSG
jgi:hypothetical protein